MEYDPKTLAFLNALKNQKREAVVNEDFRLAKEINEKIKALQKVGQ